VIAIVPALTISLVGPTATMRLGDDCARCGNWRQERRGQQSPRGAACNSCVSRSCHSRPPSAESSGEEAARDHSRWRAV